MTNAHGHNGFRCNGRQPGHPPARRPARPRVQGRRHDGPVAAWRQTPKRCAGQGAVALLPRRATLRRRVLGRPVLISDLAQRHQRRALVVKTNAPPLQGRQRRDHRLLAQSASTVSAVSAGSVESAAAAERTVHTGVGRTARPGSEEWAALAEALRSPGPHQARMRLNQPRPQAHSWRVAASVSSRVSFSYRRRPHRVRETPSQWDYVGTESHEVGDVALYLLKLDDVIGGGPTVTLTPEEVNRRRVGRADGARAGDVRPDGVGRTCA